jgi:hypothetical protein
VRAEPAYTPCSGVEQRGVRGPELFLIRLCLDPQTGKLKKSKDFSHSLLEVLERVPQTHKGPTSVQLPRPFYVAQGSLRCSANPTQTNISLKLLSLPF